MLRFSPVKITFDHSWIAYSEIIIGDIAYDDRTNGDNATFTHSDTRTDGNAAADSNRTRSILEFTALHVIHEVLRCVDTAGDENIPLLVLLDDFLLFLFVSYFF